MKTKLYCTNAALFCLLTFNSFAEAYTRFAVFGRSSNNSIYYTDATEPGNGLTLSWTSIGKPASGGLTSDPSAVCWGEDRIDVFARSANGTLAQNTWTPSLGWDNWNDLGGGFIGSPDAASWGIGRLDIFTRSVSNTLSHLWYNGSWQPWEDLGAPPGGVISDPSAVSWGANRIDIFVTGTNGNIWQKAWNGSWSAWADKGGGGQVVGAPDAGSPAVNKLQVFARFADNKIYHSDYTGSWSAWTALAGAQTFTSDPGAVCPTATRTEVYANSAAGLMRNSLTGATWSGWIPISNNSMVGGPDACKYSGNQAFVHGTFEGEDFKDPSGLVGVDININGGTSKVDIYGLPTMTYGAALKINNSYPCRPVPNGGGVTDGASYPCIDPHTHHLATHVESRNFVLGPLHIASGKTWSVFFEAYPKDANGVTQNSYYTDAVFQNLQVGAGGVTGMHVQLANTSGAAKITGHVVKGGVPYAGAAVRLWGGPSGNDTGYSTPTANSNGDFTAYPLKPYYLELQPKIKHNFCMYGIYIDGAFRVTNVEVVSNQTVNVGTITLP